MDFQDTTTIGRKHDLNFLGSAQYPDAAQSRLDVLLVENAESKRKKDAFVDEAEEFEAGLLRRPLTVEKTFAYFGLMLGSLPPAAIFARMLMSTQVRSADLWIIGVFLVMDLLSAVVGYFSGKWIGRLVSRAEKKRWSVMLTLLPLYGVLWGVLAGAAGGFIVFLIGAVFGAVLGGMVGAAAFPVFGIFHRLLKRGDMIELKHFLPIAFGISLTICSFILSI